MLGATSVLRGLGAGIILGTVLIALPLRRRIDLFSYARFARSFFKEEGVKAYAVITLLGFVGTVALAILTVFRGDRVEVGATLYASLAATALGFVGTAGAYPATRRLWSTDDSDERVVAMLLDRFAYWSRWSAASHAAAFVLIIATLLFAPR